MLRQPTTLLVVNSSNNLSCRAMSKNISTIDRDCLAIEILVSSHKQHTLTHISIITRTIGRYLALEFLLWYLALLVGTTLASGGHLAREDTRRNTVDTDLEAVVGDLEAEHLCEVDDGCFRGVVSKVVLRCFDDTGDGANVDHAARVAILVLGGFLQEWKESGGHEVALWDARHEDQQHIRGTNFCG